MNRFFLFFAALLVCVFAVTGSAKAVLIDDFNTGDHKAWKSFFGDSTPDTKAASGAIGGIRKLDVITGGASGFSMLEVASGKLTFTTTEAATAAVTWDAGGSGFSPVDLTEGATVDQLGISILGGFSGTLGITLTVTDASAGVSTLAITGTTAGANYFDFADFTGGGSLASAKSIVLDLSSTAGAFIEMDWIQTALIPEPATVMLLGIGLAGLGGGYLRRRYSKAKKQ